MEKVNIGKDTIHNPSLAKRVRGDFILQQRILLLY